MTEKELKANLKKLSEETSDAITGDVTAKIKKDLDFDGLVKKLNEVADSNKSLIEKMHSQNVYKIFTSEDSKKDIEEADQKELAKAFSFSLFKKDNDSLKRICQKSYDLLPESKKKALSEGVNADGGYLVPEEFYNGLIVERDNTLQLRNMVTIWQMKRLSIEIPKGDTKPRVFWGEEGEAKSTTTLTFSRPTLTAYKLVAILRSSDELLDDSVTNIQQYIIGQFSRALKEAEEKAILIGTGTGQPTGLFVDTNISTSTSTTFSGITGVNELKSLFYSLPVQYRATAKWIVPDSKMEVIDKFVDGNNRPFLQASVADGTPQRILGKEVVVVPDEYMTGKTDQIMFGDLKDAYILGDRHQMRLKISQDESISYNQDKTAYRVVQRLGGIVIQPKAVRKLISIT